MEALMTNNTWQYVCGDVPKPRQIEGDADSEATVNAWLWADKQAKSDLILSISPSELQQVRECATSREIWIKLQNVYASKGPARKATLLKQLILQWLPEGENVRQHMDTFFDAVDKLATMGVEIHQDQLCIMLLYSLPQSFENFRCAIESRDVLPTPEVLKIKIL